MKLPVVTIAVLALLWPTPSEGRARRNAEEAETAYIKQVATGLNTLCDGAPPEYCTCDNNPGKTTKGPYDLKDVLNLIITIFGCGPGDCKCAGVEELIDARSTQLKKVLAVCPKDENGVTTMEKAKCQNGDEIDYPFDLKHLFFVCHPTALKCKGGDFEPYTGFGCAAGGFSRCGGNDWSREGQMACSDGVFVGFEEVIKNLNSESCICKDGKAPRCVVDGKPDQYPTCPDGSQIAQPGTPGVGTPGPQWDTCEKE